MAQGVFVIAEQREGEFRKISYEVVSEGRRLADELGQEVIAVVLGSNVKDKASELAQYGADKIKRNGSQKLIGYNSNTIPLLNKEKIRRLLHEKKIL